MQKPIRRWRVKALLCVVAALVLAPAYVRVYTVAGASDAPTLLLRDRVLVNLAAYDLKAPYTSWRLLSWASPQRGDMVLCEIPDRRILGFKRIIAVAGDTVELRDNHLLINGRALRYKRQDRAAFEAVPAENRLGQIVDLEQGVGDPYLVTYTPGVSPVASFGPLSESADAYFVLGDSRDNSHDSRMFGPLSRSRILGKVIGVLGSPVAPAAGGSS